MKERSDLGNYLIMSDNIAYYMNRDRMTRHELAKALVSNFVSTKKEGTPRRDAHIREENDMYE